MTEEADAKIGCLLFGILVGAALALTGGVLTTHNARTCANKIKSGEPFRVGDEWYKAVRVEQIVKYKEIPDAK